MESLLNCLPYIDPDDYETWIAVGMALKHEGYSCSNWDAWSAGSNKYKAGACEKKWKSFNETNSGEIVTGGTVFQMARDNGYRGSDQAFGWDDEVNEIGLDYKIIDPGFVKEQALPGMKGEPIDDLREYLHLVFHESDYVGYCDKLDFIDGKWVPVNGLKSRTAGQLLEDLKNGFEHSTIRGESEGGAMIRFNPLDGQGEKDVNVVDFRYCMVESDKDSIEKQYALYQEMKLPVACLVHSGNKSLHAIIHVDAGQDYREYQKRVNFIYDFCKKNGLNVDPNDKNASRYSRLPGIKRGENYQYIVARNIGFSTYEEWKQWADTQNDNLPEDVCLADISKNPPPLKDELIEGVLRVSHKLLISGPSKAGKSFLLMNLAVCFATGSKWLNKKCKQGKVLYVNLELDEASCYHRFIEICENADIDPESVRNLVIWNLRGRAVPMDKLTPFLINRYKDKGFVAIIIDPIYKVITGDENSATEMSTFCSYFDRAAIEIGAAMIYCHHHSKGAGNKYSNSADRASGSGVFARDPDAILDMVELNPAEAVERYKEQVVDAGETLTAWEISSTLREFPPEKPVRIWFDYPMHVPDTWNFLAEAKYSDMGQRGVGKDQKAKADIAEELEDLFNLETFNVNDALSREHVMDALGLSDRNIAKHTSPKTNFEPGTLSGGMKVIFRRGQSMIIYNGCTYKRPEKSKIWEPC